MAASVRRPASPILSPRRCRGTALCEAAAPMPLPPGLSRLYVDHDARQVVGAVPKRVVPLLPRVLHEVHHEPAPGRLRRWQRAPVEQVRHRLLERPQIPHAVARHAEHRPPARAELLRQITRHHLRPPGDAVLAVVKVAKRASHVEHHLREASILGRHQHRAAVASLRLEAAAHLVRAAQRLLREAPRAGRVAVEDAQELVLAFEHVRVVVDHLDAGAVQPRDPLVQPHGRVLRHELLDLCLAAAGLREDACRVADRSIDERSAVDDRSDRRGGAAVDGVVPQGPVLLLHLHDEHPVALKHVRHRLDRLPDGGVRRLEHLAHHRLGLGAQTPKVRPQVLLHRGGRRHRRDPSVLASVPVQHAVRPVGFVDAQHKVRILVLLGPVSAAAAVSVLVVVEPQTHLRRRRLGRISLRCRRRR
mmetsp:Transcript_3916/g.12229  ORF Transcript_3916/g.12229 Transcript_3916/m.12229 type:complete len:418 (+) Transcript_3916:194-1447(+)